MIRMELELSGSTSHGRESLSNGSLLDPLVAPVNLRPRLLQQHHVDLNGFCNAVSESPVLLAGVERQVVVHYHCCWLSIDHEPHGVAASSVCFLR